MALLDATDPTDPLGRLKTLLLGPRPQQAPGVGYPWDIGYLLDYLRDALLITLVHGPYYAGQNARRTVPPPSQASVTPRMCLHVGTQHRIHPREMARSLCLEPFQDVRIEPKMYRGLAGRHHHPGIPPELVIDRTGRRVTPRLTRPAGTTGFKRFE